ncbi:MAG: peptidylprolyl isomerase [Evtepia sp.]|uniref:peptidylprolyl isomerase n=1 Tax=Evtepia sp. TaxID=2773933 RepID=UPI002A74A9DF|nr:peptidylprolyl isomerase [Evtepia sp.]MDY3014145.1 peptidylprolyl isomerase [Evtepia sp.]
MGNSYRKSEPMSSKHKLYWVIGVIAVVIAAALIVWNSGIWFKYSTAATVGDNEYSVSELSYYYHSVANQTIQNAQLYAQYGMDSGYDPSRSPSEQMYNQEEGKTYADYFLETALSNLQRTTILCKEAEAASYTLSEEGQKTVQDNLNALKIASIQAGSEDAYLKMAYGRFMTKSLFKDILTQSVLADEYAKVKAESFTYSDEELQTYYNEHAADLDSYEYRLCPISAQTEQKTDDSGNPVEPTEEETKAAMEEASQKANQMIAQVKGGTAFNTAAASFVDETTAESYKNDPDYQHSKDVLGKNLDSTIKSWMTEAGRRAGDITSIEGSNGYYVVQFLGRDKGENSYQTMDYRNILIMAETTENADGNAVASEEQLAAAKEKAEALLEEWKAGDATADSFAALAKENSADEASKANGGLYEKANRDTLPANSSQWLFETGRKAGDTTVVEYTDTNGNVVGYQILLAGDMGEIRWKYQAASSLRSDDYNAWYEEVEPNYPASLTDAAKKIPTM